MYIFIVIVSFILGWEGRNVLSALIKRERKRYKAALRQQKARSNRTWAQIRRVGPQSKEVVCK